MTKTRLWPLSSLVIFATLFSSAADKEKDVTLKWKPVKGAQAYNLEISKDPNFGHGVIHKQLKTNAFNYNMKSGLYYLRVQGIDRIDTPGLWSKPFKLVVTPPPVPVVEKEVVQAKPVHFIQDTPQMTTSWKPSPGATSYRVQVVRDGKEVFSHVTPKPTVDFKPDKPGQYKVMVSSGLAGKYFGPPVTVQSLDFQQVKLKLPKFQMPPTGTKKFSTRKPVKVQWSPVEGAKFYQVKIYKSAPAVGRAPATQELVATMKTKNPALAIKKLKPGRYVASVSANESDTVSTPMSTYQFDVKKAKPVEFDALDFSARYYLIGAKYSSVVPTGSSGMPSYVNSQDSMLGGFVQLEANLWFPESRWGLKAISSYGGIVLQGMNLTNNDLRFAGQYRLPVSAFGLSSDVRLFFGGRAWNMNLMGPNGGGSSSTNTYFVLPITVAGPMLGFEATLPVAEKWGLFGRGQFSTPIFNSMVSNGTNNSGNNAPTVEQTLSAKVELGFKYALPGNLRLLASTGFQSDSLSLAAGGNKGVASSRLEGVIGMVGLETDSDGRSSFKRGQPGQSPEYFSNFDFAFKFGLSASNYQFHPSEDVQNGVVNELNFTSSSSGTMELDAVGWFKDSKWGGRLIGGWDGLTYTDAVFSNPHFHFQAGYRPDTRYFDGRGQFQNYFGLRYWQVPILRASGGSGSGPSNYSQVNAMAPGLLGLAETAEFKYQINSKWKASILAEVSSPLYFSNRDSMINNIYALDVSWKTELSGIYSFNEDLSLGASLGYQYDRLKYTTSFTDATPSTATLISPTLSVTGIYSF